MHGPSPDGRYLCHLNDASGDLAVWDGHSGEDRLLTRNTSPSNERAESCRFSPDGGQIAYAWFNPHLFYDLRVIALDGSGPRVLYRSQEVFHIEVMNWSPDGKQIAARLTTKAGICQMVLISVTDGSVRVLKTMEWDRAERATFSPDGRHIAYDRPLGEGSPARDIFVLPVEGGREIPLIQHPANDLLLGWSADRQIILFASDRTGTTDAWIIRVNEGRPQGPPILVKRDLGSVRPIGLSRKGAYYYGRDSAMHDVHLATIDPASGKLVGPPVPVAQRFVGSNVSPDWSPDGRSLAYISHVSQPGALGSRREPEIVIRSLETGEERELATGLGGLDSIRWSPAGSSLLVVADNVSRRALFQVDPQTGHRAPVILFTESRRQMLTPALSPDGSTLFYRLREWTAEPSRLMTYDMKTGKEKELLSPMYWFALSPDGRWLAYTMYESAPRAQLVKLMPAAGGPARELYRQPQPGRIVSLTWTPDGRYLLFAKRNQLWRLPAQGGEPEQLDLAMDGLRDLRVHPDGRRLAFTAGRNRQEIWVMENFLPPPTP